MNRPCLLIFVLSFFSISVAATDVSMPPKNPKAQTMSPPAPNTTGEYGEVKFKSTDAKLITAAPDAGDVVIKTTVAEVCPKKGCWMTVNGEKPTDVVRVTFKDYGFFVPQELNGKEIAMQGRFLKHIESVEEQKHLLKDAKRPQSEIDAITKPKETLRFVATGVKDLSPKTR
ncbi:MAG: DUF4920 domain-containing protein [Bdellovibrionales bacterium]|nr:DUF4920 domain-containing protein [Bdellovibrionales bacterium]